MTVRTQLRTDPHLSGQHPFVLRYCTCARRTLVARVTACPRHTHPFLSYLLLSRGLSPPLSLLHPSPRPTARLPSLLLRLRPPALPSPFNLRRPHVHVHCTGKAHSTMYHGSQEPHSWPPAPVSSNRLPTLRQPHPLQQPPPFHHRNASGKIAGILQTTTRRRTRSALVAPPTMMSTERNFTLMSSGTGFRCPASRRRCNNIPLASSHTGVNGASRIAECQVLCHDVDSGMSTSFLFYFVLDNTSPSRIGSCDLCASPATRSSH